MSTAHWWEPRFEGALHRDQWPPELFGALAERARAAGLRVIEDDPPHGDPSYRSSAAPERSLELQRPRPPLGAWDRVQLLQDGGVLRYGGSFRGWSMQAGLFAALWLVALREGPGYLGEAIVILSILAFIATRWWRQAEAKRFVESLVEDATRDLEPASSPVAVVSPVVAPPPAVRVPAVVPIPHAGDPALAATAKTARDAVTRHGDRSPEDEVEAIEGGAMRGDKDR